MCLTKSEENGKECKGAAAQKDKRGRNVSLRCNTCKQFCILLLSLLLSVLFSCPAFFSLSSSRKVKKKEEEEEEEVSNTMWSCCCFYLLQIVNRQGVNFKHNVVLLLFLFTPDSQQARG